MQAMTSSSCTPRAVPRASAPRFSAASCWAPTCLSSGYYDAYYKKARAAQRKIREEFANAFEKCDVILTPVAPTTAYELGAKTTNPLEMYAGDICTVSVNIAGLPGSGSAVRF